MKIVVKNTTKIGVLDLLCPHSCRGCGRLGSVLCECCKKNLFLANGAICPLCKREVARNLKSDEVIYCADCKLPFRAVFVGGWREGVLAQLIKDYKYRSVRAVGEALAEILDGAIGEVGKFKTKRVVIVPLPTIGKHIRERGLDHTLDLAKRLAKRRRWEYQRILGRKADTVQVGATRKQREEQAAKSYEVVNKVRSDAMYLLLDDIWTTGASVLAAAEVLRSAGVQEMMVAVLATGRAFGDAEESKKS